MTTVKEDVKTIKSNMTTLQGQVTSNAEEIVKLRGEIVDEARETREHCDKQINDLREEFQLAILNPAASATGAAAIP